MIDGQNWKFTAVRGITESWFGRDDRLTWQPVQSRWTGGGITNSCGSIPVDKADGAARPAYRQLQLSGRFIGHRQNAHKFQLIPCAEQHNQNVQR